MGVNDGEDGRNSGKMFQLEGYSLCSELRTDDVRGGRIKTQAQRFTHAWPHIHAPNSTPDETSSLQGTDITYKKAPLPNNGGSIFGGVTGLKEFDYS